MLEHLGHREEGCVRVKGRARALDPHVRLGAIRELFAQGLDESRLPDARLAHDQHRLTVALARELEARSQQAPLVFSADEGAEAARPGRRRGQATASAACTDDAHQFDRLRHPAKPSRAERLHREQTCHEAVSGSCHEHPSGARLRLHARRDVRGLSQREHLTSAGAAADLAHDYGPGVDPDTHREPLCARARAVDTGDGVDQRKPRAHRALGIVAVGRRPAEVREQAIAEVLRDVATVARDHALGRTLVAPKNLAPVLGVEPRRDLGGAHEVAEEDSELAAPRSLGRGRGVSGLRERGATRAAEAPERADLRPANPAGARELRAAALAEAGLGAVLVGAGSTAHRLGSFCPMLSRTVPQRRAV